MSVILKAMELGHEISQSTELHKMRETEASVHADQAAAGMIQEFQVKQRVMAEARSTGRKLTGEEQDELVNLHQRMTENPKIKEFMEAQRQFHQMINDVNRILQQAITGNTCTPSG
ncbi:MAG: YlbF family regulator [Bacillota bacterium]